MGEKDDLINDVVKIVKMQVCITYSVISNVLVYSLSLSLSLSYQ